MAKLIQKCIFNKLSIPLARYGHYYKGKPPGVAKTLEQKMAERNAVDQSLYYKVNIGYKPAALPKARDFAEEKRQFQSNKMLEQLARKQELEIPLDEVENVWKTTMAPFHIKTIAEHYGVYQDLFGDAFFYPVQHLDIDYKIGETYHPVYTGNVIKPCEASKVPEVHYEADENSLWTLVFTNPDGHLTEENAEYVLWFIGNIPGNDLSKGEVIWNYLQPFPARGTGYQRCIFVLYKQNEKVDYSSLKQEGPCLQLSKRTFVTQDFYRKYQDKITPAGLKFFQSDWDSSLTDFFHKVLDMTEPTFEYDFPEPYIAPQEWMPRRRPFNRYMDKYRDPKQIAKEYLLKKFKERHPFEKPPPPLRFPNAHPLDESIPSWLKEVIRRDRLGLGHINDH